MAFPSVRESEKLHMPWTQSAPSNSYMLVSEMEIIKRFLPPDNAQVCYLKSLKNLVKLVKLLVKPENCNTLVRTLLPVSHGTGVRSFGNV